MSRTIKTYKDLQEEKELLKNQLTVQRQRIINDWNNVKDGLSPVKNAFGVVGKMAKGDHSSPLVNLGLKVAGDIFLKNFILAKAGWVTKLAVPFVMKNYSSHLLADKGKIFLSKLGKIIKRRRRSSTAVTY